jgi:hypothetical protein
MTTDTVDTTAAATEAAAKPAKAKKEPKVRPTKIEQNGVTRPTPGTVVATIWDQADQMSRELQAPVSAAALKRWGATAGLNLATVGTQYNHWRVFNGLKGVTITDPEKDSLKAEKEAASAAKKAEAKAAKEAAAAAKAAEKAAKKAAEAEAKAAAAKAEPAPV